jgi:hypothetical protein
VDGSDLRGGLERGAHVNTARSAAVRLFVLVAVLAALATAYGGWAWDGALY